MFLSYTRNSQQIIHFCKTKNTSAQIMRVAVVSLCKSKIVECNRLRF